MTRCDIDASSFETYQSRADQMLAMIQITYDASASYKWWCEIGLVEFYDRDGTFIGTVVL